jgi:hypothetical protein
MSLTIQQGIPCTLTQGDAVSFTVSDSFHPATGWTSQIVFKNGSNAIKTFNGAVSGELHLFELTSAEMATIFAGLNLVCLVFTDPDGNRQSSDWQEVNILADPTKTAEKTFAQNQVDLLQTVIGKLNASGFQTVNFNGQSFTRTNISEYQKQLTFYEARVIREQRKADIDRGIRRPRSIAPSFFDACTSGSYTRIIP